MAARIVHHAAAERLLKCVEFKNSGDLTKESPTFFFTGEMADEFIEIAVDGCLNELNALQKGVSAMNETLLAFAW